MILLFTLLAKSLLVFALAGAALLLLRRASAAARHLVCLLTLASLLALPLFSLTLPGWHLPVLEPTPARSSLSPPETGRDGVGAGLAPALSAPPALKALSIREIPTSPEPLRPPVSGGPLRSDLSQSKEVGFLTLYLLGVLLASLRPLLGLWGIARLNRLCLDITDPPTLTAAVHCAEILHLPMPRLCRADVCVPMTWGWRRPVVLLPASSTDWPEDRLLSVLLHEMAHIKRRDWSGHRFADLVCAVYWFHPLVWLTARRLRTESELACDDLVLTSGISAPDYARHLLDIAQALASTSRPTHSVIAMAQTARIEGRIAMILDKTQSRRTLTRRVLVFALILVTAALVTLAILRPVARTQTAPIPQIGLIPQNGPAPTALPQPTMLSVTNMEIDGKPLLVGVTSLHKPGSTWWSASGAPLLAPVYDTSDKFAQDYAGPLTQNIALAFRLPPAAQGITVQYKLPQATGYSWDGDSSGKCQSDAGQTEAQLFARTHGARIVSATFPPSLKKTNMQIGIASGAWRTTALETRTVGAINPFGGTSGSMSGNQTVIMSMPLETAKGYSLTVSTDSTDDLRIVAVDTQGHELLPDLIGENGANKLEQITAQFNLPLSKIKEFRLETRPFQWVEFKDVALKPIATH